MDFAKSLIFDWYNGVFTASIVFWLLYLFITLIGGSTSDHMEVSHDADHDLHDISHDGHDLGHGHGLASNLLSFLGVGKCPLSIILMLLGVSFGFIGLICNGFFASLKVIPAVVYFWPSAIIALLAAISFTRVSSIFISRYLPKKGTTAIEDLSCLVGCHGETSLIVDKNGGRVKVEDQHGTLHNIYCSTIADDDPIPPNTEVLIVSRLADGRFLVRRIPKFLDKEVHNA